MDDPPLSTQPVVETVDDAEFSAEHIREPERVPGDTNTFTFADSLRTDNPTEEKKLPPKELTNRTFLMPPRQDGTRVRAKIIKMVNLHKDKNSQHPDLIRFKCLVNDDYEEIVAYNDIVDYIEQDQTWEGIWKFKEVLNHQGPIKSLNPNYRGSRYNLKVEWETGEITWEPLTTANRSGVYETDPVTVAAWLAITG